MKFISHGNGIESRLETERINAIILEDSEQYTGLIQKLWNQIHKVEETLFLYGAENELLDMSKLKFTKFQNSEKIDHIFGRRNPNE